ncbi:MAG: mitochondrial fission ELM1 family protein [Candidatus Omnitrophica bacterium]|nr:mitochondrial fission ELM1 family protein [Candidatus Omnitrophota bacterium]MBU1853822.1 mitochondrial fission ELM1 family protein [Candidatus Omnitrophota bacterium]
MNRHSLIDFLGYIILKILSILLGFIPLCLALWIGRRVGDLVCIMNSKRRAIAYANLKSAFPEKTSCQIKRITKSHFENLGMSIIELLRTPRMGKRYLEKYISVENLESVKRALDEGKGMIFLAAHFGNWEVASLAISAKGYRMSLFAREQKYKRLNSLLNQYRAMTGCKVVTKGFSIRDIIKTLNNNGMVAMLFDQDAGPKGVFVELFNRPASTAQGVVSFSLKTGAAILPTFVWRVGYDKHIVEIGEPLELVKTQDKEKDIRTNLEKITGVLEHYIRRFPEQWLWSHKRWKTTPQRTVLILSDGKSGHFNQSLAVAEMIEEALGTRLKARGIEERPILKIKVVKVKFKNKVARLILDLASFFTGRRCQGCLKGLRLCLEKESFNGVRSQYADIIISCGASLVSTNIFLKYENNAKNIVIMKPGLGKGRRFDIVILPGHDIKGERVRPNVVVTEAAPNRITEKAMEEAITRYPHTPRQGIGLLIGGDAKNFKLKKEDVEKVVDGILNIANKVGMDVFVSTSRRTSGEIDALLKQKLQKNPICKRLVIANEKNIDGIVPAIFGLSDVIVTSPESISMISEAVSSGKYTVVFRGGFATGGKYERAVKNLEEQGYIKTASPGAIQDVIDRLLRERPAIKKLGDRDKIVKRLQGII